MREVFATKRRERTAALKFLKRTMKRYGRRWLMVNDQFRSYGAAIKTVTSAAAISQAEPFCRPETPALTQFRDWLALD